MTGLKTIVLIVSLLIIVTNQKIRLINVFSTQLKIYINDRNQKVSIHDVLTFIVVPIIVAYIIAGILPYEYVAESTGTAITVFSIIATVLLSFLALLVDKVTSSPKEKEVVRQTFVTITINIIYSMVAIALFVIGNLVSLSGKFDEAFIGIICFFIIKIVLNILMILKRIYCVLSNN